MRLFRQPPSPGSRLRRRLLYLALALIVGGYVALAIPHETGIATAMQRVYAGFGLLLLGVLVALFSRRF